MIDLGPIPLNNSLSSDNGICAEVPSYTQFAILRFGKETTVGRGSRRNFNKLQTSKLIADMYIL